MSRQRSAGEAVRAWAFRRMDALRGGAYAERLRVMNGVLREGTPEWQEWRSRRLRRLLDHAATTTSVYRDVGRGASLGDFPVVDKNYIRENSAALLSDKYRDAPLAKASTSGSTGTPLVVLQDQGKRLQRSAEAIYFGDEVGYRVGMRLYNLKVWSGRNRQSPVVHLLRNTRPVDVIAFREAEMRAFLARLRSSRGRTAILAYSSVLEDLARFLDAEPDERPRSVAAVIAQSEAMSEEARSKLRRSLGAPVVVRYGAEEVGIIAQQRDDSSDYVVNRAGVVVEILKLDRDETAAPGEVGRIVVTDLHNRAMPMIRYDTGDVGAFAMTEDGAPDQHRLAVVEGRRLDRIYDADGRPVSSFIFYKSVWKYPEVRQFQLVQETPTRYRLRLNVTPDFAAERALLADFREHLGAASALRAEYVDEIPVLRSGKRQQVVQEHAGYRAH